MKYTMRLTNDGSEKDIGEIHTHIKEYNRSKSEKSDCEPLCVYLENDKGDKLAGLTGETYGNWLCIKFLWVSEELRGNGIGKSIMEAAEKEAKKRGCRFVFVDTFDFQAPGFYRKLGYKDVFALNEYPYTGARYYFTKTLV